MRAVFSLFVFSLWALPALAGGAPDLAEMQTAYDRAAMQIQRDKTHVDALVIVGSECESRSGKFFCQIGFKIEDQGDDRIYLDVASFERSPAGELILVSGLCRR